MHSSNPADNYQKMSPPVQGIPMSHPLSPSHQVGGQWATGLFDCFSDCETCCLTFWCPCITFGRIAEIVDKGATSCGASGALYTLIAIVTGCQCFYSCFYRTKIREQYNLQAGRCGDCLLHCCCEACALCQEYRELKYRGYHMSLGWHGNVERKNGGVAMAPMAPVIQGGMTR